MSIADGERRARGDPYIVEMLEWGEAARIPETVRVLPVLSTAPVQAPAEILRAERAGLRRVLELADARAVDVLLVAELSRIGWSLSGLANVVERLSARGVGIVSLRESFDLTSPMGRMVVGILSVLAVPLAACGAA
ncbi:MAG: recombinase family protein [Planctomycetes bacterium]|nr:recombinase family protein [Planctomycetota bacterium]